MQRRSVILGIALLAATAIALVGVQYARFKSDPLNQPGETWVRGVGNGHSIRLLETGRYVAYSWCDICPHEPAFGHWSREGNILQLHADSGGPVLHLWQSQFRGCTGLLPTKRSPRRASLLPSDFYFRKGDSCASAL